MVRGVIIQYWLIVCLLITWWWQIKESTKPFLWWQVKRSTTLLTYDDYLSYKIKMVAWAPTIYVEELCDEDHMFIMFLASIMQYALSHRSRYYFHVYFCSNDHNISLKYNTLTMLNSAIVLHVFDYADSVYNSCIKLDKTRLQSLQSRIARILTGSNIRTVECHCNIEETWINVY